MSFCRRRLCHQRRPTSESPVPERSAPFPPLDLPFPLSLSLSLIDQSINHKPNCADSDTHKHNKTPPRTTLYLFTQKEKYILQNHDDVTLVSSFFFFFFCVSPWISTFNDLRIWVQIVFFSRVSNESKS